MSHKSDPKLLEHARILYARGERVAVIARVLRRSLRTIMRWKSADAARGLGWEDLRDEMRHTFPTVIVTTLERRLLATANDDTLSPGARGFEIRQLYAVLTAERAYAARMLGQAGQEDGADAAC